MRSAPQKALDFFNFDLYKALLSRGSAAGATLHQTFLAAGLAGATSCLLLYPLDVRLGAAGGGSPVAGGGGGCPNAGGVGAAAVSAR
jgi:solute carrier family 25 phosphate transporter 23/24/25/41